MFRLILDRLDGRGSNRFPACLRTFSCFVDEVGEGGLMLGLPGDEENGIVMKNR